MKLPDIPIKTYNNMLLFPLRNESIIQDYVSKAQKNEVISFKELEKKYRYRSTMEIVDPEKKFA